MDPQKFHIPKQTDEALVRELGLIKVQMPDLSNLSIRVFPHINSQPINISEDEPAKSPGIAYVLSEKSEIMPNLYLMHGFQNDVRAALTISRMTEDLTDTVTVHWNEWARFLPQSIQSQAYVKLMSLARKHLRALDVEATLSGGNENAWSRYRDSQQIILNSLQETQRSLLVEYNERVLHSEQELRAKYEKVETDLRAELSTTRNQLIKEHEDRLRAVETRETAITSREKLFDTKEARYITRKAQEEQMADIKNWLQGWSLTTATSRKWWFVTIFYLLALIATGVFTAWLTNQSFSIIKISSDKLNLWQWIILLLKPVLPFAAFTTLLIYFIRWSSVWARQHSEEDFRNRARILDIGRSRWLLEAVRDAQDHAKELPPDLLKELSKNLFNASAPDGNNLYPEALTEFLSRGLASLKVKAPNGIEVEANAKK